MPSATFVKGVTSRWFTFVLVFYTCIHRSVLILDGIFMPCLHLDKIQIRASTPVMNHVKSVMKTTIGNTHLEFEPDAHTHSRTAGFTHWFFKVVQNNRLYPHAAIPKSIFWHIVPLSRFTQDESRRISRYLMENQLSTDVTASLCSHQRIRHNLPKVNQF